MNGRNPQRNAVGTIDLEIEHPDFGWIPFTAAPDDVEAVGRDLYARAESAEFGAVVAYVAPIKTTEQLRAEAKQARTAAVQAITVTTQAGNTFDGDETSQTRMARAIIALQATGTPTVTWVLADNTVIQATVAELTEALALSGAAQAAIWVLP